MTGRPIDQRQLVPGLQFPRWLGERSPGGIDVFLEQQELDSATGWNPACLQPGWNHPAVVGDKQVAWSQPGREIPNPIVGDLTGLAVENEQSRRVTLGQRSLSDQILGEIEVKIRNPNFMVR